MRTFKTILVMALVLAMASMSFVGAMAAEDEIKIAVLGPMTGDYSLFGGYFDETVNLAVNQYNAKGGYNGTMVKVELFDDKNDAKESVTLSQRIVNEPGVIACVGPFSSTCALADEPTYTQAGVVLYCPTSSHVDFTGMSEYMIRGCTLMQDVIPPEAKLCIDQGLTKAVYVYDRTNDSFSTAADIFKEEYTKLGGEVVASDGVDTGMNDFSALIAKYKQKGCDNIHLAINYGDMAQFINQCRDYDLNCLIVPNASNFTTEVYPLIDDPSNIVTLAYFDPTSTAGTMQEWIAEYTETCGRAPSLFSYVTYTAATHILRALDNVGPDPQKIAEFMRNDKGHVTPSGIVEYTNGDPAYSYFVQEFTGDALIYSEKFN